MTACMEIKTPSEIKVGEETKLTFNIESKGNVINPEGTDYVWTYPLFCIGIENDNAKDINFSKFDILLNYGIQSDKELKFKESEYENIASGKFQDICRLNFQEAIFN
jgi:hypothetical protein